MSSKTHRGSWVLFVIGFLCFFELGLFFPYTLRKMVLRGDPKKTGLDAFEDVMKKQENLVMKSMLTGGKPKDMAKDFKKTLKKESFMSPFKFTLSPTKHMLGERASHKDFDFTESYGWVTNVYAPERQTFAVIVIWYKMLLMAVYSESNCFVVDISVNVWR